MPGLRAAHPEPDGGRDGRPRAVAARRSRRRRAGAGRARASRQLQEGAGDVPAPRLRARAGRRRDARPRRPAADRAREAARHRGGDRPSAREACRPRAAHGLHRIGAAAGRRPAAGANRARLRRGGRVALLERERLSVVRHLVPRARSPDVLVQQPRRRVSRVRRPRLALRALPRTAGARSRGAPRRDPDRALARRAHVGVVPTPARFPGRAPGRFPRDALEGSPATGARRRAVRAGGRRGRPRAPEAVAERPTGTQARDRAARLGGRRRRAGAIRSRARVRPFPPRPLPHRPTPVPPAAGRACARRRGTSGSAASRSTSSAGCRVTSWGTSSTD